MDEVLISCTWSFNCPKTICRKVCLYSILCSQILHQKLSNYIFGGLSLDPLISPIGQNVCIFVRFGATAGDSQRLLLDILSWIWLGGPYGMGD